LLAVAVALPAAAATAKVVPKGTLGLAGHTAMASRWLDPQEHDGTATSDHCLTALIKNQGPKLDDHLALAESFEFAPDAKSATVVLRKGVKFHHGEPVTAEDVKFTYEHYRGAKADVFKAKTERIDIVDDRTVRFVFKEPFLDFKVLYGTPATGAGPYKLVRQEPGVRLEVEALADDYRPVHIQHLTMLSVPEAATRVAMLERGEADLIYLVPGELIDRVRTTKGLMLAPVLSGSWFLEFPGFQAPHNPFRDRRVREAVSLAIDEAETGGLGQPSGTWLNADGQEAIAWPEFERDVGRARQLLAAAGYPQGFEVDWLTPLPPYDARGERIRAQRPGRERGLFSQRLQGGLKAWPGSGMILQGARTAGSWAFWYEAQVTCGGFHVRERLCLKDLDEPFGRYEQALDPAERQRLAAEIQRAILAHYDLVPVFRHAFVNAIGPRVAAEKWQDVFPTITTGYAYPWEDIKLR
jgi:peptide/nickel transport system substrate-binding protein